MPGIVLVRHAVGAGARGVVVTAAALGVPAFLADAVDCGGAAGGQAKRLTGF
jgi:hypothetical protein